MKYTPSAFTPRELTVRRQCEVAHIIFLILLCRQLIAEIIFKTCQFCAAYFYVHPRAKSPPPPHSYKSSFLQSSNSTLSRRNLAHTSLSLPPIYIHGARTTLSILTIVRNLHTCTRTHLTNLLINDYIGHGLAIDGDIFIVLWSVGQSLVFGLAEGVVVGEGSFESTKDVE